MTGNVASRKGILFICGREAIVLVAYPDAIVNGVQRYSIGMGHNNDSKYPPGTTIDILTAFALVREDVSKRGADLNRWLKGAVVSQQEFDALLSIYYEYGNDDNGDKVAGSMIQRICALIAADHVAEAGLMFLQCDLDPQGKQSAGLLARRIAELRLFTLGDYGAIGKVELWRGDPSTTKPEMYTVQDTDI